MIPKKLTDNKDSLLRIVIIMIFSVFILFVVVQLRGILPKSLLDYDDVRIDTIGLCIMIVFVLMAIVIPSILNRIQPPLKESVIVVYTGLVLFITEFLFKFIQNIFVFGNGLNFKYIDIIQYATIVGFLGIVISNISIHKIRKKSVEKPVLIFIGIWILFSILLNLWEKWNI